MKNISESNHWIEFKKYLESYINKSHENKLTKTEEVINNIRNEIKPDDQEKFEQAIQHFCLEQLKLDNGFVESWSGMMGAVLFLTHIQKLNVDLKNILWTAAETAGVSSYTDLVRSANGNQDNWSKHEMSIEYIFRCLVKAEDFNLIEEAANYLHSNISEYWKAYFFGWSIFWKAENGPDSNVNLSEGDEIVKKYANYIMEFLVYRLANFDTEFVKHPGKVEEVFTLLDDLNLDIPIDRVLREEMFKAFSYYFKGKKYTNRQAYDKLDEFLNEDAISFVLENNIADEEIGKYLLDLDEKLHMIWDDKSNLKEKITEKIVAALNHPQSTTQEKAKEFLKRYDQKSKIQDHIESLAINLDAIESIDNASNLLSSLIEFGSQITIKTVIRKCVLWMANDENWSLIERASQKITGNPATVQPLISEMNISFEDKQIQNMIKLKVIEEQNNFVLSDFFVFEKKEKPSLIDSPLEQFVKESSNKERKRDIEDLGKWCMSFKNHSEQSREILSKWKENLENTDVLRKEKETVELADKLLNWLTKEKMVGYNIKVQQWITSLLSHMSDRRYYDTNLDLFDKFAKVLQRHAIEPLGKRLPNVDDLETRENIVRVLGNVGGPASVEALVRTVSGTERQRKARQDLLSEYYLKPSKERSEEASALLNDAVENAKSTMRLLQILNTATFVIGAALVIGGVIIAVSSEELGSRFIGLFSGMGGIGAIVTIFMKDPLKKIQNAMSDLVQIQTAFTGFVWDLNLNGTYIQSQYVAEGVLKDQDIQKTSERIANSIDKTMNLIQIYAEGEYEGGPPQLSYLLPPAGSSKNTISLFGENLVNPHNNGKKVKQQIAINHKAIDTGIESWTKNYVIVHLSDETINHAKTSQNGKPERLWFSLMIDGVETNALPFNLEENKSTIETGGE